jgi:hypothetical protein
MTKYFLPKIVPQIKEFQSFFFYADEMQKAPTDKHAQNQYLDNGRA